MTRFTCPRCGRTSQHPIDALEGYCGHCHAWIDTSRSPWHFYFDRQGEPIDEDRFGVLHDDEDYKRIGLDTYPSLEDVAGDPLDPEPVATISTVWMGINHAFRPGRPAIFETMIFGGPYDQGCARYSTEADAVEGHWRTMEDLRAGRAPWFLESDMEQEGSIDGEEGGHR